MALFQIKIYVWVLSVYPCSTIICSIVEPGSSNSGPGGAARPPRGACQQHPGGARTGSARSNQFMSLNVNLRFQLSTGNDSDPPQDYPIFAFPPDTTLTCDAKVTLPFPSSSSLASSRSRVTTLIQKPTVRLSTSVPMTLPRENSSRVRA